MSQFQVHTIDSAPADSAASLRTLEQALGFVPNLAATMAESPTLVNSFVDLRKILAGGELTGVESGDRGSRRQPRERLRLLHGGALDFRVDAARGRGCSLLRAPGPRARRPQAGLCTDSPAASWRRKATSARKTARRSSTRATRAGRYIEVVAQVGHTMLANFAHSISGAPLDEAFQPQARAKAAA